MAESSPKRDIPLEVPLHPDTHQGILMKCIGIANTAGNPLSAERSELYPLALGKMTVGKMAPITTPLEDGEVSHGELRLRLVIRSLNESFPYASSEGNVNPILGINIGVLLARTKDEVEPEVRRDLTLADLFLSVDTDREIRFGGMSLYLGYDAETDARVLEVYRKLGIVLDKDYKDEDGIPKLYGEKLNELQGLKLVELLRQID